MKEMVLINGFGIQAENFVESTAIKNGKTLHKITFEFIVTHEDYHDVTTLLYKNDFLVSVPNKNLQFSATINNYSTSLTNLYEENAQGKFQLELIEKS
ncbi:DUF3219 family protein [Ornithinibacillus sp. L9]|uniref:DUF3219 family protein n=1 Tax=Ornithinibacillus caprae TaxID=2678566 RepID=A0A6N8FGE1_9BACI|nr:DUF3219 family protein [Ornithinibacillus caprae]MUK88630.1 DUF3219 family protein [Ornithinibacillus caprae]